jgi:hypothetical protein
VGNPAFTLLIAWEFACHIAWKQRSFVAQERFQPDVFGSVKMNKRLPNRPLADCERRVQLLGAQASGGGQKVSVHPGPVLMKPLE